MSIVILLLITFTLKHLL